MGLGQARRQTKLSRDPNNTAWSRSSTAYGQRILQSHGWTPGSFLGAENISPSVSGSFSRLSPIRVVPKDDNFGLGVRDGVDFNNGKCTGLDVFHGILGRLNGKDGEQIQRQENPIEDQKKATKQESRFGALLFVSGGFLGESGQEELLAKCIKQSISKDEPAQAINRSVKQSSRTTKENPATPTELIEPSENRISRKNRVRSKLAAVDELRSKNSESYTLVSFEQDDVRQTTSTTSDLATEPLTAAQRLMKAERKQRKSMKREARRAISTDLPKAPETLPATNIQETSSLPPKAAPTGDLTVPQSRRPMGGRHAVRQRYISHKRMAMMDSKALNEILMVKG